MKGVLNMQKVLALNKNGDLSYCEAPPEMRGKGRCNHITHQNPGETPQDFVERINKMKEEKENKEEVKPFIPFSGTTIKTKP